MMAVMAASALPNIIESLPWRLASEDNAPIELALRLTNTYEYRDSPSHIAVASGVRIPRAFST